MKRFLLFLSAITLSAALAVKAAPGDTVFIDVDSTGGGVVNYGGDFGLISSSDYSLSSYGDQLFSNGGNKGNGYVSYQPNFQKSGYYKIYDWVADDSKEQWVPLGIITGEDSTLTYVDHLLPDSNFYYVQSVYIDTAVHNEFIYFNDNDNGSGGIGDYVKVDGMLFIFVDSTRENGNVTDTIIWDAEALHKDNWFSDAAFTNNYMNLDQVSIIGEWEFLDSPGEVLYDRYFASRAGMTEADKGMDSIVISRHLPKKGFYTLQMSFWTSSSWRSDETPVSVTSGNFYADYVVNQQEGDEGVQSFVTLGDIYVNDSSELVDITVSNSLNLTRVGLDAYRFIYQGNYADTEAPAMPASLQADTIGEDTVSLSWDASTDNVGVEKYVVLQDGDSIGESVATTLGVSGLNAYTSYEFAVFAVDASDNHSDTNSLEVKTIDVTAPTAPADLSASDTTTTSLVLSWSASTDNVGIEAYIIYQDGLEIAAIDSLMLEVTSLAPATEYAFVVEATDSSDNRAASDTLYVTTLVPDTVAVPELSDEAGTFTDTLWLTLSTVTDGATIYYTDNGHEPTASSTEYTAAIKLFEDVTIKAIAVKDGLIDSDVVEAVYVFNLPTGIQSLANIEAVSFYPNPANDRITISNANGATLVITSINGQIVRNLTISSDAYDVDLSNLTSGAYIVKIDGETFTLIVK